MFNIVIYIYGQVVTIDQEDSGQKDAVNFLNVLSHKIDVKWSICQVEDEAAGDLFCLIPPANCLKVCYREEELKAHNKSQKKALPLSICI